MNIATESIDETSNDRVVIIGGASDLIQPLVMQASIYDIDLLCLNRSEWDLEELAPSTDILQKITLFNPNHLVYAAGINQPFEINDDTNSLMKSIKKHIQINCLAFVAIVHILQKLLPQSLISVHALSSLYGIYGRKLRLPYSLSKHALEGAIKCLATELPNTLVIGYRPGFFQTKLTDQNLTNQQQEKLINRIPMRRLGHADELSDVILRNILHPPLYATGSVITMDGGLTAGGLFEF